ncbi:TetR/AcrR family transcriptional regulator [Halorubrum lacusprofundi]|jgi:AcrR family transcriptional regulator|uniref:Transcriptional regulator, TetR family n=1 Tax=Halorubrum lacusprofundi (strain ATCC 49239 / DSM 5036 / JCM 8891 / ACAM 34) TaxID=416348 RepID=B9LQE2_HALLT|nr:TetR/AcrR family transcriptional regulator [Halorubrum lacusprofundi]ACM57563.1 transcriptional regulator, TetR family [Halorubrum lacusprofundi ATCC 49239]MCG1005840.1 TetR/AcrR family transcriptional regulator [Halorubrum lacusprofundi]
MSEQPGAADEIMDGVYRALRAHGYADVTMQDIADECSKSKSLLHYHYDTKEDLLVAFLDHVISDSERRIAAHADDPPVERLSGFIGWFVFEPEAIDREAFHIALLELRTQGPFNQPIREQLVRSDRLLRGTVVDILESGIEEGVFRDVDVEETAALLVATLDGARTRQITLSRGANAAGSPGMNGDRSDTDDSGRNGTGGSASGGTSGGDASGTGTLDAVDRPEPTYTRAVAEATLRRIVEPLLAEGVERPSLEAGIAAMTPVDEDENE